MNDLPGRSRRAGRLHDEGFHPTVLTLWRNKLRVVGSPAADLRRGARGDRRDERVGGQDPAGVGLDGARRRGDPSGRDHAARRPDPPGPPADPGGQGAELVAHDYDNDPGKPVCAWNDRADIDRVVTELVNDARTILAALDGVELDDVQTEAVGLLALVAGQDVEPGDSDGTWRIAPVTRPDRIVSVHDPESRHVHKTNHRTTATGSKPMSGSNPTPG